MSPPVDRTGGTDAGQRLPHHLQLQFLGHLPVEGVGVGGRVHDEIEGYARDVAAALGRRGQVGKAQGQAGIWADVLEGSADRVGLLVLLVLLLFLLRVATATATDGGVIVIGLA